MLVRNASLSDISAILEIQQNPLVMKYQYHIDHRDYRKLLERVIRGDNQTRMVSSFYSFIEVDGRVAGYVRHDHWNLDVAMVMCSLNLAPEHWGYGLMYNTLTELIEGFGATGVHHVFADCFYGNARCFRLLKRLGFVSQPIPLFERLGTAWQMRCLRWVVRNRLDLNLAIRPATIDAR